MDENVNRVEIIKLSVLLGKLVLKHTRQYEEVGGNVPDGEKCIICQGIWHSNPQAAGIPEEDLADCTAVQFPCGHRVGSPCIDQWFEHANAESLRCPHCQVKLELGLGGQPLWLRFLLWVIMSVWFQAHDDFNEQMRRLFARRDRWAHVMYLSVYFNKQMRRLFASRDRWAHFRYLAAVKIHLGQKLWRTEILRVIWAQFCPLVLCTPRAGYVSVGLEVVPGPHLMDCVPGDGSLPLPFLRPNHSSDLVEYLRSP
jgi:hypothetical protein